MRNSPNDNSGNNREDEDPFELLAKFAKATMVETKKVGTLAYNKVKDPEFRERVGENAKIVLEKGKEVN